jgi:hypothetical protein
MKNYVFLRKVVVIAEVVRISRIVKKDLGK